MTKAQLLPSLLQEQAGHQKEILAVLIEVKTENVKLGERIEELELQVKHMRPEAENTSSKWITRSWRRESKSQR